MKFATQARVIVPGTEAQGVIVDATETVPGFPIYTLRWLDEAGETHTGTCGEGDLAGVNRIIATPKGGTVEFSVIGDKLWRPLFAAGVHPAPAHPARKPAKKKTANRKR